ncbi:MAG: hypothetical protein LBS94_03145, partial [Prevotellaceae bacterium]|nr:hypothetical protein [Prevotellaceae bacterium]
DAQIVRNGRWNLVCVGGTFGSFSAAARRLSGIKSQLGEGGGGDEEEESDEEESDEEEYEEDEGGGGYSGSGEAWICGI